MNIAVIAGGLSPERDVSLSSGCLIANSLARSGHKVALLDVCRAADRDMPFTSDTDHFYAIPTSEPDLEAVRREFNCGNALVGDGVIHVCKRADVVFVALHGAMGENGQIQALFDSFGIRYTGSPYAGCLLAMDKTLTKLVLTANQINTPGYEVVSADMASVAGASLGYPCVVKPSSCGSSVGVSIVHSAEEMKAAAESAKKYGDKLLIEKFVRGREFACGVLKDKALPPIEIRPKAGFYDYKNKYQKGMTEEICPAPLTPGQTEEIMTEALRVHRAIGLGTYSRSDFILDEETGKFTCLEANTLPGMTPTSLLPQEAAAAGISYDTLCEIIASEAL